MSLFNQPVDGFEPVDFFRLFVTDEVISLMTKETNRYAQSLLQQSNLKPNSTAGDEMKTSVGLILLLGPSKRHEIQMSGAVGSFVIKVLWQIILIRILIAISGNLQLRLVAYKQKEKKREPKGKIKDLYSKKSGNCSSQEHKQVNLHANRIQALNFIT